jgi:DNA-binding ferritin-like protein
LSALFKRAQPRLGLAALRALAADACREDFGDTTTADVLRDLAEHHKKDASMLGALLWEDNQL